MKKHLLKRFLHYYRPHRKIFYADMASSMLLSFIGIIYPIITRRMLNDFIPNKNYRLVVLFGIMLLGAYFIKMLLNYFVQYYGHVMGVRMQAQMRSDMFNKLETLPFGFFDNNETGKIMSRMTNDLMDISELAHHGPENLIISTASVIIAFIYLSTVNIYLALVSFICVPFLIGISASLRKKMRKAFMDSRTSIAEINASLESSISGIRVTKSFNNSAEERKKFEIGNKKFVAARKDAYKAMGQFHSGNTFVTDIFNVVVLIVGGLFLYKGKINLGDYSAFIISINMFVYPVLNLIGFMEQYQNGVTGFERFTDIMDAEPEKDSENAVDAGVLSGQIEFKNVSYAYDGENDVLENVNFTVNEGEKFALVGPSGGGKTTICHLIPHFYNVTDGEILIDGKEIHTLTMESLRRNIGIVQQDVYLFNASVKDNILYGRLGASDEEVIEEHSCN